MPQFTVRALVRPDGRLKQFSREEVYECGPSATPLEARKLLMDALQSQGLIVTAFLEVSPTETPET